MNWRSMFVFCTDSETRDWTVWEFGPVSSRSSSARKSSIHVILHADEDEIY